MADEIHRIIKQSDYVVLDKRFLHNASLSWKAKGILAYVLTLPDDWTFRLEEIITHSTDKRDSFRTGWKELQEQGYVKRMPSKDEKGVITHWETHIFERPQTENPLMEAESTNGKSKSINGLSTHWETQTVDNPTLLSIERALSIDSTNSSSTSEPVEPDGMEEETVSDVYTQVFGTFAMPPLFTGFVQELKRKGRTDRFVIELLLEAGESSSGKPTLKFVRAIADRWLQEGIESREQAATKKSAGYSPARQPPKSSGWRPSKPDLPIVQNDPEQSGVSDEEFAEYVRLAEEMKASKGAGPRAGDEE